MTRLFQKLYDELYVLFILPLSGWDIFISYNSNDLEYARNLKEKLEQNKYKCFLDRDEIRPGEELKSAIDRGLLNSKTVVVVGSENIRNSQYVPYEIKTFKRTILPININKFLRTWDDFKGQISKLWIDENTEDWKLQRPSTSTITEIKKHFKKTKVRVAFRAIISSAFIILAILLLLVFNSRMQVQRSLSIQKTLNNTVSKQRDSLQITSTFLRITTDSLKQTLRNLSLKKDSLNASNTNLKIEKHRADSNAQQAIEQRDLAIAQRNRAERNSKIAIDLASEGLVSNGYVAINRSPSLSIAYGYTSYQLKNNLGAIGLIQNATMNNPIWRKITPGHINEDKQHFYWDNYRKEESILSIDAEGNHMIYHKQVNKTDSSKTIELFDVDQNKPFAEKRLGKSEQLLSSGLANSYFSIRKPSKNGVLIDVYFVTKSGTLKLIKTIAAQSISFSENGFPAYSISKTNGIERWEMNSNGEMVSEKAMSAGNFKKLFVKPDGKEIVAADDKTVVHLRQMEDNTFSTTVVIDRSIFKLPFVIQDVKIVWSLAKEKFIIQMSLVDTVSYREYNGVYAIDSKTNAVQAMNGGLKEVRPLDEASFMILSSSADGDRIVFPVLKSLYGNNELQVVDLDWNCNDSVVLIKRSTPIKGSDDPNSDAYISTAILSPTGNYLVYAQSSEGVSGLTNVTGKLQSCDLTPLDMEKSDLALTHAPLETGSGVIKELLFNKSSSRLFALDANGVYYVYKTRIGPPPLFNQGIRVSEDTYNSFANPKFTITGRSGNEIKVKFGEADIREFNLYTGKELSLKSLLNDGEEVIDYVVSDKKKGQVFY